MAHGTRCAPVTGVLAKYLVHVFDGAIIGSWGIILNILLLQSLSFVLYLFLKWNALNIKIG